MGWNNKNPEILPMIQYEIIKAWLTSKTDSERGASLVEYALLVALIAVVCIVAVTTLGGNASDKLDEIGEAITTTV